MSNIDIIRAWKDEEYRNSLSEEQRSQLPENPAGLIELPDEESDALSGGCSYFTGTCGRVCAVLTPKYGCKICGGGGFTS
ncbi:mersacidin/lichenicidin family type 2 lantibiotic [Nodularia harveyana UHCC-0300]|uniref:Mersacidin/lichenicidin family type 2 lantibiotic n=1 Tax=Nodularia harveyana UHCC-0300 TaxID=2974287 RepID=A0ABU5UFK3_9CYAN|nr:mersacidin/lichenicidin family type 2 lantibiotic [Nodularia harveyana]MEA5581880.1 mersacidin/lichenicidin family type 2 lantibiotic [Nodularia harveyana UHCC-0300]